MRSVAAGDRELDEQNPHDEDHVEKSSPPQHEQQHERLPPRRSSVQHQPYCEVSVRRFQSNPSTHLPQVLVEIDPLALLLRPDFVSQYGQQR
jgi:hypothetical protein